MKNNIVIILIIIGVIVFLILLAVLSGLFNTKDSNTPAPLDIEAEKWNKMIDLWSDYELEDPIKDVITYDAEVQNGGHLQFFENCQEEIEELMISLKKQLPNEMYNNLKEAYELHKQKNLTIETVDDYVKEAQLGDFDKYDLFYYANEKKIHKIMQKYALTLELND